MSQKRTRWILVLLAGLATSLTHFRPLSAASPAKGAADEAAIRAVIQQRSDAWGRGDGNAYAAGFTEDADYITFGGMLQKGRQEIASAHQQLFDTVLKGTRLQGAITSVRFLSPDIALSHTTHGILFPGQSEVAPERKSIQTLVLMKREGQWRIAALQVTRVQAGPPADR